MEVRARAERLAARAADAELDGLLVTRAQNILYLTGFTGAASLLVTSVGLTLVTDGRYADQAVDQLRKAGVSAAIEVARSGRDRSGMLLSATQGLGRLGLEAEHVSWSTQRALADTFPASTQLVPSTGLVEALREIKDAGEVARREIAATLADAALASVRHRLREGVSERRFALELESELRILGADDRAFEIIVASGPNGAKPHARPTNRIIDEGDLVVVDFGALVDGYRSDLTRTLCVGRPSPTQRRMLEIVTAAQAAGVAAVCPGVTAAEIDGVCRDMIADAGWADAFLHSTGHGIGLDVHELPWLQHQGEAMLRPGHVVTIEPGVYLPEHGGVRVEDMLLVTSDGSRTLTRSPKGWMV
jgi:Xaa-Pro aminopeptidase